MAVSLNILPEIIDQASELFHIFNRFSHMANQKQSENFQD
jgi:hypothetical protein